MSKRSINEKRANKLRGSLRNTPSAYVDLVSWLLIRKHAKTKGEAKKMLLDGRVRYESHPVGRIGVPDPRRKGEQMFVLSPYLPVDKARNLWVVPSE